MFLLITRSNRQITKSNIDYFFEDCEAGSIWLQNVQILREITEIPIWINIIARIPADAIHRSIRVEDSTNVLECSKKYKNVTGSAMNSFPQKATKCKFCRPTSKYFVSFCGRVLSYLVVPVSVSLYTDECRLIDAFEEWQFYFLYDRSPLPSLGLRRFGIMWERMPDDGNLIERWKPHIIALTS